MLLAIGLSHPQDMIGIEGFGILQEVVEAIIDNGHNPLEVVYGGAFVPPQSHQKVL